MQTFRETPLAQAYLYHRQRHPKLAANKALAMAKGDMIRGTRRYAHSANHKFGGSWQPLGDMPPHSSASDRAYYCDNWPEGWRVIGTAAETCAKHNSRMNSLGYYTDDLCNETLTGYVLQLPARGGRSVYIPGTAHSDWDGVTLYPLDMYDDPVECARAADGYAERAAEKEREYQTAWQAGSLAADMETEANDIRSAIITTISDLRAARRALGALAQDSITAKGPLAHTAIAANGAIARLCKVARDSVETSLEKIRELRQKRDNLIEEYTWRHNGFRVNHLRTAFYEGYGHDCP